MILVTSGRLPNGKGVKKGKKIPISIWKFWQARGVWIFKKWLNYKLLRNPSLKGNHYFNKFCPFQEKYYFSMQIYLITQIKEGGNAFLAFCKYTLLIVFQSVGVALQIFLIVKKSEFVPRGGGHFSISKIQNIWNEGRGSNLIGISPQFFAFFFLVTPPSSISSKYSRRSI